MLLWVLQPQVSRGQVFTVMKEFQQLQSGGLSPATESKGERDMVLTHAIPTGTWDWNECHLHVEESGAQVPGAMACYSALFSQPVGAFNQPVLEISWFYNHLLWKAPGHLLRGVNRQPRGLPGCLVRTQAWWGLLRAMGVGSPGQDLHGRSGSMWAHLDSF